jgi:hypothetical protein
VLKLREEENEAFRYIGIQTLILLDIVVATKRFAVGKRGQAVPCSVVTGRISDPMIDKRVPNVLETSRSRKGTVLYIRSSRSQLLTGYLQEDVANGRAGLHQTNIRMNFLYIFDWCIPIRSNRDKARHTDALFLGSTCERWLRVGVLWTAHRELLSCRVGGFLANPASFAIVVF